MAKPSRLSRTELQTPSSACFENVVGVQHLPLDDFNTLLQSIHPNGLNNIPIDFPSRAARCLFTFDAALDLFPRNLNGVKLYGDVQDNQVPSHIVPDLYRNSVAPNLWHTLRHLVKGEYFSAEDIGSIQQMLFGRLPSSLLVFDPLPGASLIVDSEQACKMAEKLQHNLRNSKPRFVWVVARCMLGKRDQPHWVSTLYEPGKKQLLVFDPIPEDQRALKIFQRYVAMWKHAFPDDPEPEKVGVFSSFPTQKLGWTCGLWCVEVAGLVFRYPSQWETISQQDVDYDEAHIVEGWERAIRKYIQVKPRKFDHITSAHPSPAPPDLIKTTAPVDPAAPQCPSASFCEINDVLNLTYSPRPGVGGARVSAIMANSYVTPYKWKGDSCDQAGRRPSPSFPPGWLGWTAFNHMEWAKARLKRRVMEAEKATPRAERLIKRTRTSSNTVVGID